MSPFRRSLVLSFGMALVLVNGSESEPPQVMKEQTARKSKPILRDAYGDPLPHGALARMGNARFRQSPCVIALTFSPDGRSLASLGHGTVQLWDDCGIPGWRHQNMGGMGRGRESIHNKICFAANGKVLFVLWPNKLRMWEVESGEMVDKLEKLADSEVFLAISPDAKTVATKRDNGNQPCYHLRDVESGKEVCQLQEKEGDEMGPIGAVDFSSDGKQVAAGVAPGPLANADVRGANAAVLADHSEGTQAPIRAWDASTGKQLWETTVLEDVSQIRYAPDCKVLAWLNEGGTTLRLLEAATGKDIRQITSDNEGKINSFVFTSDGKSLILARDKTGNGGACLLQKVEVATGKEKKRWEAKDEIFSLALAPDGKTLAFGDASAIRLFDTVAWKPHPLGGHEGPIVAAALSADGKTLLTVGSDLTVRTWDKATGKETRRFDVSDLKKDESTFANAVFSPDGKILAATATKQTGQMENGTIHLWETGTGKKVGKFDLPGMKTVSLQFSPDGRFLASACTDSIAHVYDLAKGKEFRQIKVDEFKDAYVGVGMMGMANGMMGMGMIGMAGGMGGGFGFSSDVAFTPDGKNLVTRGPDSQQGDDGSPRADFPETRVRVWEIATGKERRSFLLSASLGTFLPIGLGFPGIPADPNHNLEQYGMSSMVFAKGGKTVIFGSNSTLQLYDFEEAKEIRRFGGPCLNTRTAAFSPDGKQLAAGTFDGAVCIWEADTGTVVGQFPGHQGSVVSLLFAADGKTLISASTDGTALVWDFPALIEEARARPPALPAEKLEVLWTDLAGEDAAKAYQAMRALAAAPRQSAPFLKEMLKPVKTGADPPAIERLIALLDSNDYNEREKASWSLEKLERMAEPALRQAFAKPPSLEVRRRLERLLEKLEGPITSPETLQALRALEVLERLGTAEAREVIEAVAKGAPEAGLTLEAKSALERLRRLP